MAGMLTTDDLATPPPGWTIIVRRLPTGFGWCLWSSRQIALDDRLTAAEARCTRAHEILHARRGRPPAWMRDREETLIEQTVASILIPLEALTRALQWTASLSEAADELRVDDRTLATRLQHLHPSGQAALNTRLADVTR